MTRRTFSYIENELLGMLSADPKFRVTPAVAPASELSANVLHVAHHLAANNMAAAGKSAGYAVLNLIIVAELAGLDLVDCMNAAFDEVRAARTKPQLLEGGAT